MMDVRYIRQTLRTRLLTVSGIPDPQYCAWEGRPFSGMESGKMWLRENLAVISERKASTGLIEGLGEVRYALIFPANCGTEEAEDTAKAIVEAFEPGQSLTGDGDDVVLVRAYRGGILTFDAEGVWNQLPIIVDWRVHSAALV